MLLEPSLVEFISLIAQLLVKIAETLLLVHHWKDHQIDKMTIMGMEIYLLSI